VAIMLHLLKTIPSSFLPAEDQGYLLGAVIMPDAASIDRTSAVSRHVTEFFTKNAATQSVFVFDGYSLLDGQVKSNAALFFVGLKPFPERKDESLTAPAVIQQAFAAFAPIREGIIIPINPPSIPGLGTTGGLEAYVQARGDSTLAQTAQVLNDFTTKA